MVSKAKLPATIPVGGVRILEKSPSYERRTVGRAVEDADQGVGALRKHALQSVQLRGERFVPLAPAERERAESSVGLAPESLHLRGGGQPFFPPIPILHRERRDRNGREPGNPSAVEERHRAPVERMESLHPGLLENRERCLPVVVPGDVIDVRRRGLRQVLASHRKEEVVVEPALGRHVGVRREISAQDDGPRAHAPGSLDQLSVEPRVAVEVRGVQHVGGRMVGSGIGHDRLAWVRVPGRLRISRSLEPRSAASGSREARP